MLKILSATARNLAAIGHPWNDVFAEGNGTFDSSLV
jgi:hypothetical protein